MNGRLKVQYLCAVLLVISSIILAFVQVLTISDIASGTLMYIAQAFLLAGSIFGLEYYIRSITVRLNERSSVYDKGAEKS